MDDHGTHAVVTGVSSGIGNYLAHELLRHGWTVSGLSRRAPEIRDSRFEWHRCDLSDEPVVASVAEQLHKPIDLVVHNAAISGGLGPGLDIDLARWRDAFEVNFFAPLHLTQRLAPHCTPNACIVLLSGGGAVTARRRVGPYAITKLADVKLAEQLALDHPNLRFYALAPGAHRTKLFEEQHGASDPGPAAFAELPDVFRLLQKLIGDTGRRLNGKLIHVRDDIEKLLSVDEGGTVRRVERR